MLILRCPAQLQLLEETLRKSLPTTLPVLGTVMTVARGNPASHEVLVDSWPHFGIVLTRLRPEVPPWLPLSWQQHPTPWGGNKGPRFHLWVAWRLPSPSHLLSRLGTGFSIPHSTMPRCRMPPGLRLAPVSPSHVPLLNATWALGGNVRSREFLLGLVRTFPSACLLGPRGRPVSWSLLDGQSTLRHGYTVPAWRGRGLSGLTLAVLGQKLHACGFPIY
ncbi:GLYL3 protein, partial [Thryothorus ludovicianus]|nr:GLYL3 protein [Thryothorus ludovicianus]